MKYFKLRRKCERHGKLLHCSWNYCRLFLDHRVFTDAGTGLLRHAGGNTLCAPYGGAACKENVLIKKLDSGIGPPWIR